MFWNVGIKSLVVTAKTSMPRRQLSRQFPRLHNVSTVKQDFSLRGGKVDRSALVEASKAPRGVGCGSGCPPPRRGRELGRGLDPYAEIFLFLDLKKEHFGGVFKLDLTEETRTQLQEEEEAIVSSFHTGYAYAVK